MPNNSEPSLFWFVTVAGITPLVQVRVIAFLYLATIAWSYFERVHTWKVFLHYPLVVTIFLAPLYEEILFRGYLQHTLIQHFGVTSGIVQTSLMFGLWHAKNIIRLSSFDLLQQMVFTGLVIWPILGYLAYTTKTIRPGVIIHFCNNIIVGMLAYFLW